MFSCTYAEQLDIKQLPFLNGAKPLVIFMRLVKTYMGKN